MFKDRVALIAGGSRGIDRSCARALAEAGATVIVVGRTLDSEEAGYITGHVLNINGGMYM